MKSDPKSWPLILISLALLATISASWVDRHYFPEKQPLTWLCFDIDGEHSALAIEPAGEGSFDFGDKPAKKLSVHLCRDGKSWVHHDTVNTP